MKKMALLAAGVLASDALTKQFLVTPDWAEHYRSTTWTTMAAVGLVIPAALLIPRRYRLAGALGLAGCAGNVLSALHGPVANPLLVQYGDIYWAFNVADVALIAACVAVAVATVGTLVDLSRRAVAA